MKKFVDQRTQVSSERSCYIGGVFCVSNDVAAFFFAFFLDLTGNSQ